MLRFLTAAALLLGFVQAVADRNPNNESEFSTISWDHWTKSLKLNPRVQHIPLDPEKRHLRPPPAHIPDTFDMFIGSSVFRDGFRCGKTLFTAFTRATYPERLHFGVLEQIYEGDPTCLDEYCKMAASEWPEDTDCRYKNQVTVDTRDAAESAGCTTARHLQQKLVGDQEFCLQVDGHSVFTNRWDENILADWASINNEMAVMTMYPHHTHEYMIKENGENNVINSIPHLCTTIKGGNGLTRIVGASMISDSWMPQMAALWGGGYSFSKCHAERKVLVDSHTPWLWDGEEFMRSANYWTYGYDLYSPSMLGNVLFHNYSKKPASFWASPVDPAKKNLDTDMGRNRVRLRIGQPFKGPVDTFELDKYGFGKVRSFENFLKFANVSLEGWMNETDSCGQLHWVPYENATEVEQTVGRGWKLYEQEEVEPEPVLRDEELEDPYASEQELLDEEFKENPVQRAAAQVENAVVEDEHGEEMGAKLRQGLTNPYEKRVGTGIPVGLVVLFAVATVFVTLSNDATSNAIRRRMCVNMKNKGTRAFE